MNPALVEFVHGVVAGMKTELMNGGWYGPFALTVPAETHATMMGEKFYETLHNDTTVMERILQMPGMHQIRVERGAPRVSLADLPTGVSVSYPDAGRRPTAEA